MKWIKTLDKEWIDISKSYRIYIGKSRNKKFCVFTQFPDGDYRIAEFEIEEDAQKYLDKMMQYYIKVNE